MNQVCHCHSLNIGFQGTKPTHIMISLINLRSARTWDVYLRKKTLEAVEAFVIMGGGVFFIIHAAIVSPPLGLSLSFFGCWYIGIIFFCFACNEEGYDKKSAIMYRVGVAAGLLYTSEMMGINTVTFRVQAIVVLLGCVGPWFGIVSECIGVLFLYNDTVSHLANVEDGIFYWCIFAGLGLVIGASFVQVFLMYDEFNYDQRKYLMRLHRQDYFMGFFCMALAGALQQGNNLDEGTLGCWLAKWAPMIFLAFTNLSKNLIRRKSAPPHHPTWWVDNTFQFQDDSEFVNVSFSIVTALATVGLTILVVIALVNCIGLDKMLMNSDSLSLFCIMHGFVMASYSGFWMIFAASGMPPHGRAKMFRIFPPGTDGPILACDPKNCVNPHIFDLFFGILIVLFGAFVFTNYELNAALTDLVKRVIIGLWVISISWKVVVHIQDYGYVPAHTPNPFDEFKRIDQEAKEKRENKKRGEQQPNEQTLLSEK